MWPHLLAFTIGVWLTAAPTVLGLTGPTRANLYVVGPLAAATGLLAAFQVTRSVRWVYRLLGLWLAGASLMFPAAGPAAKGHGLLAGAALVALVGLRGRRT